MSNQNILKMIYLMLYDLRCEVRVLSVLGLKVLIQIIHLDHLIPRARPHHFQRKTTFLFPMFKSITTYITRDEYSPPW